MIKFMELLGQLGRLMEIGITKFTFFDSKELFNSPFIDILCSISQSLQYHHYEREPQNSDLRDIAILASVLPYCDIVTTDSFMKEVVVKTLHLDKKYNCEVFAANRKDREAFQKLIRELK